MIPTFHNYSLVAKKAPARQCCFTDESGERCGKMFIPNIHQKRKRFCCLRHQQSANAIRAKVRKQRARSLTPTADRLNEIDRIIEDAEAQDK